MKSLPARLAFLAALVSWLFSVSCSREKPAGESRKKKTVETLADLGALPLQATDPADNVSSPEKIALGRLLFFDPVLSGNKDVACATCHHPDFGYAEFLETSIGVNGVGTGSKRRFKEPNDIPRGRRNSQSVLNTAFNGLNLTSSYHAASAPMFWDLRASGLEEQALAPIKTLDEMRGHGFAESEILGVVIQRLNGIQAYKPLFAAAFPGEDNVINETNLARAIAAFERTLVNGNTRFDQYMRGDSAALTASEKDGLNLFLSSGCAKCHNGPMFSDFKLHALGVPDADHLKESDKGAGEDFTFRTPTLRNLRYTAPYMHSGKFANLKQVLEFYEDIGGGKIRNPHMKPEQMDVLVRDLDVNFRDISRIVEFINVLSDDSFDRTVPTSVPSGLRPGGNL
ncbi:cytochrome c peroxidase [Ravibacter arvi]|uniref:Cytochrome c peroxidase n=1 Tax=Ravibacter arvi TaxID=2051041 RepID=A0ABP8MA06_9BACT